jgi:hypothetical protein
VLGENASVSEGETIYLQGVRPSTVQCDVAVVLTQTKEGTTAKDVARASVLKMEFATKTDSDTPAPMEFAYNTTPYPVVDVNVDSYSLLGNGTVRLVLSGTVTDAASDLVDDPAKQVGALEFHVGDELVSSVTLTNEAAPEPPWKPYKYAASFSETIEFEVNAHGAGHHVLELVTSENVAGNKGLASIDVTLWSPHILDDTYNLVIAEDPPGDTVVFYAGDRDPQVDDPALARTDPNVYAGLLTWGHVTAEITDFAGLTGELRPGNAWLRGALVCDDHVKLGDAVQGVRIPSGQSPARQAGSEPCSRRGDAAVDA